MGQVTCSLKRSHFPGGLRILRLKRHLTVKLYTTRQVFRPPPWNDPGSGGWGLNSQARFPQGVVLEPKCDSTSTEFILCTRIVKCANSRSFLASPNQCDPGASLSKTIGIQGIQEDELAGSRKDSNSSLLQKHVMSGSTCM